MIWIGPLHETAIAFVLIQTMRPVIITSPCLSVFCPSA